MFLIFFRFGENFPWRGRQTLCKNFNNEIISEEFKRIRQTNSVEEFSNLLKRHNNNNKVRKNFENYLNPISSINNQQQQLSEKNKNINSNENIETFIELASQCYNEGFQIHLNILEECSRRAVLLKKRFGKEISTRKKINENHKNLDENFSDNTEDDDENILSVLSVNLTEREISRKIKFSEIMSSSDHVETFKKLKKNSQFNDFCSYNYNTNIEPPKIILTDFSRSSEDGGLKSTILLPSQNYQYSYDNEEINKLGHHFNGLKIPNDNYRSESRPP